MPADDEHETDEHEALGPPPGAPGLGYWARQARQLPVINAIQQLIEDEPDRFTGLTTNGSSYITLHLVDRAVLTEPRLVALLEQARAADIEVIVPDAARSRSELSGIRDEIVTARPWGDLTVRGFGIWIDPAAATVAIEVASKNLAPVRMALRRYGDAVVVTSSGPPSPVCPGPPAPARAGRWRRWIPTTRSDGRSRRSRRCIAVKGSRSRSTTPMIQWGSMVICARIGSGCSYLRVGYWTRRRAESERRWPNSTSANDRS